MMAELGHFPVGVAGVNAESRRYKEAAPERSLIRLRGISAGRAAFNQPLYRKIRWHYCGSGKLPVR